MDKYLRRDAEHRGVGVTCLITRRKSDARNTGDVMERYKKYDIYVRYLTSESLLNHFNIHLNATVHVC